MTVTRTASALLSAAHKTVSEYVVSKGMPPQFTPKSASGQQSLTVNNECLHLDLEMTEMLFK